jgi:hypothetical protein
MEENNKQQTKQELADKVKELEVKLAESEKLNQNVSRAFEIKSQELENARKDLDYERSQNGLRKKEFGQKLAEEIQAAKKAVEEKLANKDVEIEGLRKELEKLPEVNKLREALEKVSADNRLLVRVSNAHLSAFRNLMKSIQGTLDNAIELEAIVTESLQTQKGGSK